METYHEFAENDFELKSSLLSLAKIDVHENKFFKMGVDVSN